MKPSETALILTVALALATSWVATGLGQQPPAPSPDLSPEHAAQMAKGLEVFKKNVGPVFVGRCVKCHGGEQTESEFDLTDRAKLLQGGAEGPVIVLGKSQESRLFRLIAHLEQPHTPEDGAKLSASDIAAIAAWIDFGAPYDKPLAGPDSDPTSCTRLAGDEAPRHLLSFPPL